MCQPSAAAARTMSVFGHVHYPWKRTFSIKRTHIILYFISRLFISIVVLISVGFFFPTSKVCAKSLLRGTNVTFGCRDEEKHLKKIKARNYLNSSSLSRIQYK